MTSRLDASDLRLARCKPNGKYAPWLFRFAAFDDADADADADADCDHLTGRGDTSLSREESNKTIFSGQINIGATPNVFQTCWPDLIKAALPCWNVDTQVIWARFLDFNRARGNETVPAGYLLGFMRKWRKSLGVPPQAEVPSAPVNSLDQLPRNLMLQISAAPISNRQFHSADLCRAIGQAAYDARVLNIVRQLGCPKFTATLALHGQAVMAGEIAR